MLKKDYSKLLSYIISITFIISSLLLSVHFWCYFEPFYTFEHSYLKLYDKPIHEHIGISEEQLKDLTHFTLSYLNDPKASLDKRMEVSGKEREIFTDDEKAHMVDVRNLNLSANAVLIISTTIFMTCFIYYAYKRKSFVLLFETYKIVLITFGSIFALLGIWIFLDFDSFWTSFHHLFFPMNDLWILDLRKDILIMIVPPDFFNHLVITIFISFILLLVIAFGLLYDRNKRILKND